MRKRFELIVLLSGASCFVASGALGQMQSKDQQICISKLNKDGAGVSQAQGKENLACLKNAGKNKLVGTAQDCLTLDAKQKVMKKRNKTVADDSAFCTSAPDFGYSGATATNDAAAQAQIDLIGDIFAAPLDNAVIDCSADKAGCLCQQKVLKDVEKIASTKLKEFAKCKKGALKAGASAASALEACVNDAGTAGSIAADTKQKIQKKIAKLNSDILAKCGGVSGAFPGACDSLSGAALGACLDVQVECRVCTTINEMDDLLVNCDLFDDNNANASCASGATPPGVVFQGALVRSTGRFTYQATVGISGANAECAAQYAGTHACTYAELQAAEGAGDLDGAQDTAANNVASFWAIDASRPDVDQCTVSVPWDYATAHTGQFADVVTLNNGTGALGALTTGNVCAFQHWVGCCL